MKSNNKSLLIFFSLAIAMLFTIGVSAQSSCCGGEKHDEATCNQEHKDEEKASCGTTDTTLAESTSGCSPSQCRGAQTKFGEAKVISSLRENLIELKAIMEKSSEITFDAKSYDIHDIVGENDDESLEIIANEVKVVEKEFSEKLNFSASAFTLPENKAKQVAYLSSRLEALKKLL